MRVADLVTSLALIALGSLVLSNALQLGIGWGTDGPESGFFPFWLATIMIVASLSILPQTLSRTSQNAFVEREKFKPVLKVLFPATGMVVLIHFVGLYVASAFYLGLYMRWIGRHRWGLVTVVSIGIPLITFLVFEKWFLVPMPKGPLEAWFGY